MAGRNLSITYAADASRVLGAQKAIDAGHSKMEGSAKKTGGVFGDVFGNFIPLAAAAAGAAVLGFAVSTISAASDQNEQVNKSKVVFGEASAAVLAFSDTSATAFGISKTAALEAAGGYGAMFDSAGLAEQAAASMSIKMVGLAGDMASFNNEDPSAMLERLRSGLAGEAEPLRQFGVFISAARVDAEAFGSGIAEVGTELTEAQKVQARYNIILDDTAKAQGDFGRTLGESLPNQIRVVKAEITDLSADLGQHLLPALFDLIQAAREIIDAIGPALEFAFAFVGDAAQEFADSVHRINESLQFLLEQLPEVETASDDAGFSLRDFAKALLPEPLKSIIGPLEQFDGALRGATETTDQLTASQRMLAADMDALSGTVADAATSLAQGIVPALIGAEEATSSYTAATVESAEAVRDQRQAELAATDAFFAVFDALTQVAEAQREVNRLERQGKQDTVAYTDAAIGLIEANLDVEGTFITLTEKMDAAGKSQREIMQEVRELAREFGIQGAAIDDVIADVRQYIQALNAIPKTVTTFVNVVAEGLTGAIGGIFAAEGFHGMVTSPTHIIAGEAGPERVDITPQGEMAMVGARGGHGGGVTVNVYVAGSVHDVGDLTRKFRDELIRLQRRNVTTGIT